MTTRTTQEKSVSLVARERFGLEKLRPGQGDAIDDVLRGRDTLVVMPTGSGKSAIYQIAGVMIDGYTIVVSPLIALQRDQVESIVDMGAAAEVNSTLTDAERDGVFAQLQEGKIEFLFLAPEQFANEEAMAHLERTPPALFVVDEAHCISEWGHDFRPDYLRLGAVIDQLGHPSILALTATASPPVRQEIVERLGMRDPSTIVRGFDRPHLYLAVETFEDEDAKRAAILERIMASTKPGIVYAATRRDTEELATALEQRGISAAAYHAGLKPSRRDDIQTSFFMDGEVDVIVATIAFGMGIDKPNVRFVYHHDISESVDAYYQEIGRAGRDGERADVILFYLPEDLNLRRFQVGAGELTVDEVTPVAEAVLGQDGPIDLGDLASHEEITLTDSMLNRVIGRLVDAGVIKIDAQGQIALEDASIDPEDAARAAVDAQKNLQHFAQSRIEMVRQYAELRDCRREFLLNYFGEQYDSPCDFCDNCDAGLVVSDAEADRPFPLNTPVRHTKWGKGQVVRYEDDTMVVLFDTVGYRTLGIDLVREGSLLEAITAPAARPAE